MQMIEYNLHKTTQWQIHDFPEEGANAKGRGANLLFCKLFPENCMKTKEIGQRGGAFPGFADCVT